MKKGFTLIELIATIIIIGLLATITTPIIITTINNSKQSAFKESVQKVIDAIELDYSENARSGQITYKYDANSILCYKCNNTSDVKLDFTGKIENAEGNITYNDGQINGHVSSLYVLC
jgi:prepilin-type N-terminal cleavage/methylation domain-containing protein